jgi:predicted pyridoxine 5'-phosphate oxidase superfamily flavin-nucleotide-binding protein
LVPACHIRVVGCEAHPIYETVISVSSPKPAPTGIASPDLLDLELAGPAPTSPLAYANTSLPNLAMLSVARPEPSVADPVHPLTDTNDQDPLPGSSGEHLLQCAYGTGDRARRFYQDQVLDHLNDAMREFVGRMDMVFIASADAEGECDSSLRAGTPGFIQVLDANHLAYPEYRGNGVLASLGNISENPHIGLLMVDFVRDLIGLHVNGRASIVEDEDLRARYVGMPMEFDNGRVPERWVVVEVAEAYLHCRKHIPRMQPVERTRDWGTDDVRRKGGDYFSVKSMKRAKHALPDDPMPMVGYDSAVHTSSS